MREGGLPIVRYDVFLGASPERAQEWSEAVVGRMREQGFAVAPARGIGERAVRGTRFGRGAAIYAVVFQVGSVACATTWAGPAAASITADVVRYARLVEGKARANPTGYR